MIYLVEIHQHFKSHPVAIEYRSILSGICFGNASIHKKFAPLSSGHFDFLMINIDFFFKIKSRFFLDKASNFVSDHMINNKNWKHLYFWTKSSLLSLRMVWWLSSLIGILKKILANFGFKIPINLLIESKRILNFRQEFYNSEVNNLHKWTFHKTFLALIIFPKIKFYHSATLS